MKLEIDGGSAVSINDAFKEDSVPSTLRSLQWQSDLDYIYASSDINVSLVTVYCSSLHIYFYCYLGCEDTSGGVSYEQELF